MPMNDLEGAATKQVSFDPFHLLPYADDGPLRRRAFRSALRSSVPRFSLRMTMPYWHTATKTAFLPYPTG
jgi:hypothetical protein